MMRKIGEMPRTVVSLLDTYGPLGEHREITVAQITIWEQERFLSSPAACG